MDNLLTNSHNKPDVLKRRAVKKNHHSLLAAFLLLCLAEIGLAGSAMRPARLSDANRPKWVPNEIIVKFKKHLSEDQISRVNRRHGTSVLYTSPFAGFKRIKVPPTKSPKQVVDLYNREPDVEYAELNYYVYACSEPNDPFYYHQWHFNDPCVGINIEPAWDITMGEPNVVVAVVDTGVAYEDYSAPARWHIDTYNAYDGHSWWCGLDNPDWVTPPGYGNGWKDYLQHSFDLTGATGTVTFSYRYRQGFHRDFNRWRRYLDDFNNLHRKKQGEGKNRLEGGISGLDHLRQRK
jgi:hypothetical protein